MADRDGRVLRGGAEIVLTAHQPAYLPWLGLLSKIRSADVFVILDTVARSHGSYVNRNRIKTAVGPIWLTVPCLGRANTPIRDVQINAAKPWRRKHWRTLRQAYAYAPHFDQHEPFFEDLYEWTWRSVAPLNAAILGYLLKALGVETEVVSASDYDFQGAKSALILDMCLKLGATRYVFGANGQDYADVRQFEQAGIEVEFQDYQPKEYPQLHGEFVPNLSAVDLLFNTGPEAHEYL